MISSTDIRSPVHTIEQYTFLHVKHENIIVLGVTNQNQNPNSCLIFEFLSKIIRLGTSYFGVFNEENVKNNFTLIYELLDEVCDFGFPQITEADTLKLYIATQEILSSNKKNKVDVDASKIAMQATGAVSWRRPDIKHRKNEAFVDIIESVNLIVSAKGGFC